MGFLANIIGTFSDLLQIGVGGPQWKNNAGVMECRNAGDTAFAQLRGAMTIGGAWVFESGITPAALTVDTHDYAPTGYETAAFMRLSSTGIVDLTGIVAPSPATGQAYFLINVGSNRIVLRSNDANSAAANRFLMAADINLDADTALIVGYDTVSSRWRPANNI